MTVDVFQLRERVVDEYRDYVRSFVNVLDDRIDKFVRGRLDEGELWPDAVLQLNPAFEMDQTLGELAAEGVLTPEAARFFGVGRKLYRHQREAIDLAQRGESYVSLRAPDRERPSHTLCPSTTPSSATPLSVTPCGRC